MGRFRKTVKLLATACTLVYLRDHEQLRVTAETTSAETAGKAVQHRKIVG